MAEWESRLGDMRRIPAKQLIAELNPDNWRAHPTEQRETMTAVLERIGWVAPVIVSKSTGMVIDGEMRIQLAADAGAEVECMFVELDEEEERVALATFDAIGEMAGVDEHRLDRALKEFRAEQGINTSALRTSSAPVARMVEAVATGSILSRLWMYEEDDDEEEDAVLTDDVDCFWIRVAPGVQAALVTDRLRELQEEFAGVRIEGAGFEQLG